MRVSRTLLAAAIAAPLLAAASAAAAGPVSGLFTGNVLARNDDGYVGPVVLPFTADFFGNSYTQLWVNNNGNVSFNSGISTYTPTGVAGGYSGQPIISPFFADVDTRNFGSGVVTYGNGTYAGHTAFGVEWPSVGYYDTRADKLNTFELVLTDRSDVGAGDFDIYFNYNQIQWETGDVSGGSNGLGGNSAAVGFSNGTGSPGSFYQFPGSLSPGAFIDGGPNALVSHTNDGVTGQYLFQVRNGNVTPPPIDDGIPEPATWALLLTGFMGTGAALRRARKATAATAA